VQRANRFIVSSNSPREQVETVKFLLQNGHCGINHRVGIEAIQRHLNSIGFSYNRSEFQNQVLTELKRRGIVAALIYPGRLGGVFIPCSENETKTVAKQVVKRVVQELTNLEGIVAETSISRLVLSARQEMESLEEQI
jgi:hypothetical protein